MSTVQFALIFLLTVTQVSNAFTFNFTNSPTQCQEATLHWSGGTPPYHLLLVPTGALHPEVRVIYDHAIESGTSYSFALQYPENSTFVAVMSDATGFGSGGTTGVLTVNTSRDSSCIQTTQVAPEFYIFTDSSVPHQCSPMQISYSVYAQPPVDIFVVIPGGVSSRVESGSPQNRTFEWTPALQIGTQLLIVAGDTLGAGKGGSTDLLTVAPGNSTSCLPVSNTNVTKASPPSSSGAVPRLTLSMSAVVFGLLSIVVK